MLIFSSRVIHQMLRGYLSKPVMTGDKAVDIGFRCLPLDIDIFGHMNNARYLQNAELARWRLLPASNVTHRITSKEGMIFLAVENKVKYLGEIKPFQKYIIRTTCTVSRSDDKWLFYKHVFKQHPKDVMTGQQPRIFCEIDLKAVVKERSGKTIKPSTLIAESEFYKNLLTFTE